MSLPTTAAISPPGAIYERAAQFAGELEAGQQAASDAMVQSWGQTYSRIRTDYDALLQKMAEAKIAGTKTSPAWLYQQERLKAALATTKVEVNRWAQTAGAEAIKAQQGAVLAAAKHAGSLGQTAMAQGGLAGTFVRLNPANLQHLAGFLADGSPLTDLLQGLGDEAAAGARQALLTGTALGKGTDWIGRRLEQALDVPRHRAVTIARTESLRVYRSVARETYLLNSDVVGSWTWTASLDSRACPACVVMDGTQHPLTATLDGHPRCRCAMVPVTKTWEELLGPDGAGLPDTRPPVRSGKAWLEAQPASVQRAVLGPGKFAAWKAGKIDLDDLVARPSNDQWGTMRRERSLAEIRLGQNANYADKVAVVRVPAPRTVNPRAARAVAKANTLEQVQEALKGDGLTPQQVLDYQAARLTHLNRLDYTAEWAPPPPDPATVATAVAKMKAAALTKGYPSKGYSQSVATYKAKANGAVGSKVGVVKSLTWQQKVDAQAALAEHDAWLQDWTKVQAAADLDGKAILAAHADAMADAETPDGWADAYADAMGDLVALPDGPAKVKVDAALQARLEAHEQAILTAKASHTEAPTWGNADGDTMALDADGYGVIHYGDGSPEQNMTPEQVNVVTAEPDWAPVYQPEPVMVQMFVKEYTDPDGYLDQAKVAQWEAVAPGLPGVNKASILEAISEAKATLPWKPEQAYVDKIVGWLESGTTTKAYLLDQASDPDTPPLSKANALAAIKTYDDNLAKQAAVLPDPTPSGTQAILGDLMGGQFTRAQVLEDIAAGDYSPQGIANAKAALKYHQDALNAQAAVVTADPAAVDAILQAVDNGWLSKEAIQATLLGGKGTPAELAAMKGALENLDKPTPMTYVGPKTMPPPSGPPIPGILAPEPTDLTDAGWDLPKGARVLQGPDGTQYLFRYPTTYADGVQGAAEAAAAAIARASGLKAPDVWDVTWDGKTGSLTRWVDGATDPFPGTHKPATWTELETLAVQKQQALDYLLGNSQPTTFLRTPDGAVIPTQMRGAFTNVQALTPMKWQDSLPGAPESPATALWHNWVTGGRADVLDPRTGPLKAYLDDLTGITDADLRAMARPYAEAAVALGKFDSVGDFLDDLTDRKAGLKASYTTMYEQALAARKIAMPDPVKPKAQPGPKAKVAKGKASWVGAEQPTMPKPPDEPAAVVTKEVFSGWLAKAEARYAANPNKAKANLSQTNNWPKFEQVMEQGSKPALKELLDGKYLTQEMYDEGLALIDQADEVRKRAQAEFAALTKAYEAERKAYARDLKDWRDANGIVVRTLGMDDTVQPVKRHKTNAAGVSWADSRFDAAKWTAKQRQALQQYTGSSYSAWNTQLRQSGGNPGQYKATLDQIDNAMDVQPIPEDVILNRGTGPSAFSINGQALGYGQEHRLAELVGSVQKDEAYMSTSVGSDAAFGGIQLRLRAPAGTRGAYVKAFSNYSTERELILARGTSYYVHAAYKGSSGRWIVEAEVVEDGFIPPTRADGSPDVQPSTIPFT